MKVQNIQFKNKTHSKRYQELMEKMLHDNVYYRAVAYLIALNDDCYRNMSSIFNIEKGIIILEGVNEGWQTSSSLRATRLMFNLWNGYCYDESNVEGPLVSSDYTVSEIFYDINAKYFFEAVKLRYPEMFRRENIEERILQVKL